MMFGHGIWEERLVYRWHCFHASHNPKHTAAAVLTFETTKSNLYAVTYRLSRPVSVVLMLQNCRCRQGASR